MERRIDPLERLRVGQAYSRVQLGQPEPVSRVREVPVRL